MDTNRYVTNKFLQHMANILLNNYYSYDTILTTKCKKDVFFKQQRRKRLKNVAGFSLLDCVISRLSENPELQTEILQKRRRFADCKRHKQLYRYILYKLPTQYSNVLFTVCILTCFMYVNTYDNKLNTQLVFTGNFKLTKKHIKMLVYSTLKLL